MIIRDVSTEKKKSMTINNINQKRLKRLLSRLINIYSPSGKEEELLYFIYRYLKRHKLNVISQEVDEDRYNLIVAPKELDIQIALIGHIDTVRAYNLDHYDYKEDGDIIMGLGSSDMKGNCAAMIEAYITLQEKCPCPLPVALALVVGEEEEGDGAEKLVKDFHFPWAIIGEPTDLNPCLKHCGYLEVQICTEGKQIHASLADKGQNAIKHMLGLLLKISNYMEIKKPDLVYNIRELSSSRAGFVVPDRCEAWLDLHFPPAYPIEEVTMDMEELVVEDQVKTGGLDADIRFTNIHRGYEIPEKGILVENLKNIYTLKGLSWNPQIFPSHSDANILWTAGQLEEAHTPEEKISFQQISLAGEIYFNLLLSYKS